MLKRRWVGIVLCCAAWMGWAAPKPDAPADGALPRADVPGEYAVEPTNGETRSPPGQ